MGETGGKVGIRFGLIRLTVENLLEGSALGSLGHVPFDDVVPDRSASTRTMGTQTRMKEDAESSTYSASPALRKRSTAPLPHLPSAPMTSTLTLSTPPLTLSSAVRTWLTMASSLG
jgi:hypothetical protein